MYSPAVPSETLVADLYWSAEYLRALPIAATLDQALRRNPDHSDASVVQLLLAATRATCTSAARTGEDRAVYRSQIAAN